jgi:hypothetical protein
MTMSKGAWVVAVCLALAVTAESRAQQTLTFGGSVTQTVNVPIDTSGALLPLPVDTRATFLPSTQVQLTNPLPQSFLSFLPRFLQPNPAPLVTRPPVRSGLPGANSAQTGGLLGLFR